MGAGVSLDDARRVISSEAQSTVPYIAADLAAASLVGCNSLRSCNRWYRVHADGRKYVVTFIEQRPQRPFILPAIPDDTATDSEHDVTLDTYLDELLALQSRQQAALAPAASEDAELTGTAANGSGTSNGNGRKSTKQPSRSNSRSNSDAAPPPAPSPAPARTSPTPTPPLSQQPHGTALAAPHHSPASASLQSFAPASSPYVVLAALPPIAVPPSEHTSATSAPSSSSPDTAAVPREPSTTGGLGSDEAVAETVEGADACRLFLTSFLDVLYTARQRRGSSISVADINTALAALPSSSRSSSSAALSRRHLRSIHPNLPAIDEVLETQSSFLVITKHFPRSLAAFLRTGAIGNESEESRLFLIYQCLHALRFLHDRRIVHGSIKTRNVMVTGNLWVYLVALQCPAEVPRPLVEDILWHDSALMRWVRGDLSNFDYLMELNRLAGRELGATDVADHPILPWVADFTSPTSGLRDLSRSKFRLKKGDDQLDHTYLHSTTSTPHHITELFSDITYYVYLARVTPLSTLRSVVRERFVAAEYPPSMARIYQWTPDECIPEFYSDARIFSSRHRELGLDDLHAPPWCSGPDDFIRWHRALLESDAVSRQLNDWIDITFGYKLSGEAAVEAKNVPLRSSKQSSRRSAFVQLFDRPHPKRMLGGGMREERPAHATAVPDKCKEEQKEMAAAAVDGAEEERKEGEEETVKDDGEDSKAEAVETNGELVTGEAAAAPSAPSQSQVDYSIRNLHLLQQAASFDAVFTALEGCYRPIYQQPSDGKVNLYDDDSPQQPNELPPHSPSDDGFDSLRPASALAPVPPTPPSPPPVLSASETLALLQSGDIFSLGCITAELFLGRPLFSLHTHRQYALGQYTPDLSSVPLAVRGLISAMIHPDPSKRPTAAALLSHPLFAKDEAYRLVYDFVSELRRQQALFPHTAQAASAAATAAPTPAAPVHSPPAAPPGSQLSSSSSSAAPGPAGGGGGLPPLHPSVAAAVNSSFAIPSDDIHTPPVRSSALMDIVMVTPPEFSPLSLMLKENENEKEEREQDDLDAREPADEGVEADAQQEQDDDQPAEQADSDVRPPEAATAVAPQLEPLTREQMTLDWALEQLELLSALPLPVYLLVLPHALSLCSQPKLLIPSISLLCSLSSKLGPALSSRLLSPSLHTLVLRVNNIDLQCELLSLSTLRTVYRNFSYHDGARDFLSFTRNSLLSPHYRIAETASSSLYHFLVDELDLQDDLEQEIAIRDVLMPMMARMGRGGSDVLLRLMIRLLPELSAAIVQRFFLPNTVALLDKAASPSSDFTRAELDVKLTCGLELLYAMLPDLTTSTLQSLMNDSNAVKSLLSGTARGPLSVPNMRRLLHILLYIVVEFSGESEHVRNEHGTTSAIGLKHVRLILPLLPLFADFLNSLVARIDALKHGTLPPAPPGSGDWDAAACYDFMRTLYVGLCVTVGPTIVRKAVSSHAKIEHILPQGRPEPAGRRKSLIAVQAVFGRPAGPQSPEVPGALDLTQSDELDRVVKHGVLGKVRRGGWAEREAKRRNDRRQRRLKETEAAGGVMAVGSVSDFVEDWMSPSAEEERDRKSTADNDNPSDDDADDEDDRYVRVSRSSGGPSSAPKLGRASSASSSSLSTAPSVGDGRKSFFSFLSSPSSSPSVALTMDMSELWTLDAAAPFKYRATAKQAIGAHQSAVLSIDSHPSAGLFLSAGRDELVKVWSVGVGSGEVHCGAVYRGHKQPVNEVELLIDGHDEQTGLVGSCDGGMHVWDIETGVCVLQSPFGGQREGKRGASSREAAASAATGASSGTAASSSSSAAARSDASQTISCFTYGGQLSVLLGTAVGSVRLLDLRSGLLSGYWRHLGAAQPVAAVRCICRSDGRREAGGAGATGGGGGGWVSTGLATGEVTVLDDRTGVIRLQWRAHDGAVLSLLALDRQQLLSTGTDRTICVWDISGEEAALRQRITSQDDSVKAAMLLGTDVLGAVGGRIGVASLALPSGTSAAAATADGAAGDKRRAVIAGKLSTISLKGNKSRGNITALAYLSAYKFVLVGADDGKLMLTV